CSWNASLRDRGCNLLRTVVSHARTPTQAELDLRCPSRFWQTLEKSAGTSGEEKAVTDEHGKKTEKKGGMAWCVFTYFLSPSVFIPCFSVAGFCIFARQNREAHPSICGLCQLCRFHPSSANRGFNGEH